MMDDFPTRELLRYAKGARTHPNRFWHEIRETLRDTFSTQHLFVGHICFDQGVR
jgi:hypothetical protein